MSTVSEMVAQQTKLIDDYINSLQTQLDERFNLLSQRVGPLEELDRTDVLAEEARTTS